MLKFDHAFKATCSFWPLLYVLPFIFFAADADESRPFSLVAQPAAFGVSWNESVVVPVHSLSIDLCDIPRGTFNDTVVASPAGSVSLLFDPYEDGQEKRCEFIEMALAAETRYPTVRYLLLQGRQSTLYPEYPIEKAYGYPDSRLAVAMTTFDDGESKYCQ